MLKLIPLVNTLLTVYGYLLLVRVALSWFRVNYYNPWVRLLLRLTDPFLEPFRAIVPSMGGIDFSPIVAFLVLNLLRSVLVRLLMGM
jgi:YggT family protein